MNLTIYVLGDTNTFYAIINAVAAVFGTGMMSGAGGMGLGAAAVLGLMITLLLVLMNWAMAPLGMGGGIKANPALVMLLAIVYSVMAVPKVTLNIQDVYTGTVKVVANVPLGVALPGATISSIVYSISQKIETAFSAVTTNHLSMTTKGFASPLALMLSLRDGGQVSTATTSSYLVSDLKMFLRNCNAGHAGFDPKLFVQDKNAIGYMITAGNYRNGLTLHYDATFPGGTTVTCVEEAAIIVLLNNAIDISVVGGATELMNKVNTNSKNKNPQTVDGKWTETDMQDMHAALFSLTNASQTAQDFMMNAYMSSKLLDAYDCLPESSSLASYNQCTAIQTSAFEQWKTDAAASGSGFLKTMLPTMNILMALFFGMAPLVMIFAMMAGINGLGILSKYLMFGIWTQTWFPFAAIINYIVQVQITDEISYHLAASGGVLSIMNAPAMYSLLSTKLAIASDMLAAVPILSWAVLSGSFMGLTALAQKLSPGDHVKEGNAAPDLQSTSPATKVGSARVVGDGQVSNYNTRANETTGRETAMLSFTRSDSKTASKMASIALGNSVQKALSVVESNNNAADFGTSSSSQAQLGAAAMLEKSDTGKFIKATADEVQKTGGFTETQKQEFAGSMAVVAQAGGSFSDMIKAGKETAAKLFARARTASSDSGVKGDSALKANSSDSTTIDKKAQLTDKKMSQLADEAAKKMSTSRSAQQVQALAQTASWKAISSRQHSDGITLGQSIAYQKMWSDAAASGIAVGATISQRLSDFAANGVDNKALMSFAQQFESSQKVLSTEEQARRNNEAATANNLRLNDTFAKSDRQEEKERLAMTISKVMAYGTTDEKEALAQILLGGASPTSGTSAIVDAKTQNVQKDLNDAQQTAEQHAAEIKTVKISDEASTSYMDFTPQQQALANGLGFKPGSGADGNVSSSQFKSLQDKEKAEHAVAMVQRGIEMGAINKDGTINTAALFERAAQNGMTQTAAGLTALGAAFDMLQMASFGKDLAKQAGPMPKGFIEKARGALNNALDAPAVDATAKSALKHLTTMGGLAVGALGLSDMLKNGVDGNNSIEVVSGALMAQTNPVGKAIGAVLSTSYGLATLMGADKAGQAIGSYIYDMTHAQDNNQVQAAQQKYQQTIAAAKQEFIATKGKEYDAKHGAGSAARLMNATSGAKGGSGQYGAGVKFQSISTALPTDRTTVTKTEADNAQSIVPSDAAPVKPAEAPQVRGAENQAVTLDGQTARKEEALALNRVDMENVAAGVIESQRGSGGIMSEAQTRAVAAEEVQKRNAQNGVVPTDSQLAQMIKDEIAAQSKSNANHANVSSNTNGEPQQIKTETRTMVKGTGTPAPVEKSGTTTAKTGGTVKR